jgi:hypothetical protein
MTLPLIEVISRLSFIFTASTSATLAPATPLAGRLRDTRATDDDAESNTAAQTATHSSRAGIEARVRAFERYGLPICNVLPSHLCSVKLCQRSLEL